MECPSAVRWRQPRARTAWCVPAPQPGGSREKRSRRERDEWHATVKKPGPGWRGMLLLELLRGKMHHPASRTHRGHLAAAAGADDRGGAGEEVLRSIPRQVEPHIMFVVVGRRPSSTAPKISAQRPGAVAAAAAASAPAPGRGRGRACCGWRQLSRPPRSASQFCSTAPPAIVRGGRQRRGELARGGGYAAVHRCGGQGGQGCGAAGARTSASSGSKVSWSTFFLWNSVNMRMASGGAEDDPSTHGSIDIDCCCGGRRCGGLGGRGLRCSRLAGAELNRSG